MDLIKIQKGSETSATLRSDCGIHRSLRTPFCGEDRYNNMQRSYQFI